MHTHSRLMRGEPRTENKGTNPCSKLRRNYLMRTLLAKK
ncbi:unnamed protein product [Ectocarpus sp. 8 AP-2014]